MATRTANLGLIKPAGGEMYDIANDNANMDTLDTEVAARIKTVNGAAADSDGNLELKTVPYAENLETSMSQASAGVFMQRTTGGDASLSDGDAWLTLIRGQRVHTGYSAESLEMTVTPAERGEGVDPITAEIDRDDFVEAVEDTSGTYTFTYTSDWNNDPSDYGITVTGTPISGDAISVVFAAEVRGTITQSNPQTFVSTGWNLYNHTAGYAKVVKYSDDLGYMIAGSYTALQFSATLDGAKTSITPLDGLFNVASDGYVWVTGGNATTTQIWATWADWGTAALANGGVWEAYEETEVDLSTFMGTNFPYGLMAVGTTADELNLNIGLATSWIERMAYSAANLATAEASGRDYEYDEDYIYIVKAAADFYELTVDGQYEANDHGIEFFTGSDTGVYAQTLYGCNLKNRLERDVVTLSQQSLTSTQQGQVRTNIAAASASDVSSLSDQIANKLDTSKVYNGLDKSASGYVLDARQGKNLIKKPVFTESGSAAADLSFVLPGLICFFIAIQRSGAEATQDGYGILKENGGTLALVKKTGLTNVSVKSYNSTTYTATISVPSYTSLYVFALT